jgi:Pectinacetylesterase
MTVVRRLFAVSLVSALGAAMLAQDANAAAPYPVNTCVSSKQRQAGRYCRSALLAWSRWDVRQDDAERDASIAGAAAKLATQWGKAESRSLAKGSNCADTTLSSGAAQAAIDAGIASVVGLVNGGLDLVGASRDRQCGRALLNAAARKCGAILTAEGKHIANLAKDADGARRAGAQADAAARFNSAFTRRLEGAGCATTATEGDVEAAVDGINANIVRDTIISPNVDDTQFTTYPASPTTYQGRQLTPVCMDGSPYAYFAKRGTVNKLLVYYQGGGACWEQLTCLIPVCDFEVTEAEDSPNGANAGFADITNPNNPFRDWNVVFVSYCSCDIHFGDAAQDYDNFDPDNPTHVEHRGYHNSQVVEKWAREHFLDPEEVFVTGSSAGAYGAWFNAPLLHEVWPASHFDVLADAGNGVITQSFLDNYFPNWNFVANLPPEFPQLRQVLEDGTGIVGYTEAITSLFPNTRWAHYSTAYDGGTGGQTGFYNIMLNNNNVPAALSWWEGSCAYNDKMREQAIETATAVPSNYRYYIGTGSRHTMWGSNKVYTDTTGGVPTLVDWVNGMLDGSGAWANVECTNCGLLLAGDPKPSPVQDPFEQVGPDVVVNCSPSGAFLDGLD